MVAKPHTSSAVHHHGEEGTSCVTHPPTPLHISTSHLWHGNINLMLWLDTIVYAAKGHGAIVSGPDGNKRQELAPGEFALIPAYAEHQEVNDSDEDVIWIITRGGRNPVVHNLDGWTKS